jgi:prepilin-type N-terminal cleavage/methylation domain-containing protein
MYQRRGGMAVPLSRAPAGRPGAAAFTLIEMSIVLVIIGLIVGGVLVGQNLIEAAAQRAQRHLNLASLREAGHNTTATATARSRTFGGAILLATCRS